MWSWPRSREQLVDAQHALAAATPQPWLPTREQLVVSGCFACFSVGLSERGSAGDPMWVAAVSLHGRQSTGHQVTTARAGAPYEPGLLALRTGPQLELVLRALPERPMADAGTIAAGPSSCPSRSRSGCRVQRHRQWFVVTI